MLSEYERRQLAMIEQNLAEEDRRLVDSLDPRPAGTPWSRRRWASRALLGFGIALMVLGLLASADGLFMQGLLFGGIGGVWMRWQVRAAKRTPADGVPRSAEGPTQPV